MFCAGLRREAAIVHEIFEAQGLDVISIVCKVGKVPKEAMGLRKIRKLLRATLNPCVIQHAGPCRQPFWKTPHGKDLFFPGRVHLKTWSVRYMSSMPFYYERLFLPSLDCRYPLVKEAMVQFVSLVFSHERKIIPSRRR